MVKICICIASMQMHNYPKPNYYFSRTLLYVYVQSSIDLTLQIGLSRPYWPYYLSMPGTGFKSCNPRPPIEEGPLNWYLFQYLGKTNYKFWRLLFWSTNKKCQKTLEPNTISDPWSHLLLSPGTPYCLIFQS